MELAVPVIPEAFLAIQNVNVDDLSALPESALRPILPCLVRMSLCAPLDSSDEWVASRKKILKCLSGIEVVNNVVGLLSIDFHELEQDARKEQQLRSKLVDNASESILISQLERGITLEFERCDSARKLRLLLSELLFILSRIKEPKAEFYMKSSELFENYIYLEEVSDALCIAQAELPDLLPIADVAEALLHVKNGPWLLCRVAACAPDSFFHLCTSLVMAGDKLDENTVAEQKRSTALLMLCEMCPTAWLTIRNLCVEHCRMPGLAISLTLRYYYKQKQLNPTGNNGVECLMSFINGLLLGNNSDVCSWFVQFIRTSQKRKESQVTAMRQALMEELSRVLPASGEQEIRPENLLSACSCVRVYAALKCITALKFNNDECLALLQLVTSCAPATESGVQFLSLGLCMLLACPQILVSQKEERRAVEWIKWLLAEGENFERTSGVKASFGEILLLVAIHFHSNQLNAIADLVSATLGMKSTTRGTNLAAVRTIFTQDIFTDEVVTSHAVKVAVTENLSTAVVGYLPVHCIYQLLKSRAFSKHKVPIKDWIYSQLCNCSTPIHPLIPPLINVYVNSIILPGAKTDRTNDPISEADIMLHFNDQSGTTEGDKPWEWRDDHASLTTQILLLYYVLQYQDVLLSNMKTIVQNNRKVHSYSRQFISQLPIRFLLHCVQSKSDFYAGIYSSMLRLTATHYPHLCMVNDWLDIQEIDYIPADSIISTDHMSDLDSDLTKSFEEINTDPSHCILALERLTTLNSSDLIVHTDNIVTVLPLLLEPAVPRRVHDLAKDIWVKLNHLIPTSLHIKTVNALRSADTSQLSGYTEDDLTHDPLIVLQCDRRVYRCPPLLEIILRVLEAFLQLSRTFLASHIQANPQVDKSGQLVSSQERDELKTALIAAQESATVQLLLETCLPRDDQERTDAHLLTNLREVHGVVCSHVHQMFISDPSLIKLVHFQGYPNELLPVTVAGIPSMHICLDFITELMSQPAISKQVFAISLVSYLSVQYAIPKSLSMAQLSLNVMYTMMTVLPCYKRESFFLTVLPSLSRICQAFPVLCEEAVQLLQQLGKIQLSQVAVSTSSHHHHTAPVFKKRKVDLTSDTETLLLTGFSQPLTTRVCEKDRSTQLMNCVKQTFQEIISSTALLKHHPLT